jgi:hypothetical protein
MEQFICKGLGLELMGVKNERIEITRPVKGNIEGYKEPVDVTFHTPNRIESTDQYLARRDKFYKWKELKSE